MFYKCEVAEMHEHNNAALEEPITSAAPLDVQTPSPQTRPRRAPTFYVEVENADKSPKQSSARRAVSRAQMRAAKHAEKLENKVEKKAIKKRRLARERAAEKHRMRRLRKQMTASARSAVREEDRRRIQADRLLSMHQDEMTPEQKGKIRNSVTEAVKFLKTAMYWDSGNEGVRFALPDGGFADGVLSRHVLKTAKDQLNDVLENEVVDVYTDGSYGWEKLSRCGEKTGGFGFLVNDAAGRTVMWGGGITPVAMSGSRDYEYVAVQAALSALPRGRLVRIHTDLRDIVHEMRFGHQESGSLTDAVAQHDRVEFFKVRSRSGSIEQNISDELSRRFRYAHDDMRCAIQKRLDDFQVRPSL